MLKRFRFALRLLLIFGFSATLLAQDGKDTYFPYVPGSYWVYEDQDGNELTRRATEKKEIKGRL